MNYINSKENKNSSKNMLNYIKNNSGSVINVGSTKVMELASHRSNKFTLVDYNKEFIGLKKSGELCIEKKENSRGSNIFNISKKYSNISNSNRTISSNNYFNNNIIENSLVANASKLSSSNLSQILKHSPLKSLKANNNRSNNFNNKDIKKNIQVNINRDSLCNNNFNIKDNKDFISDNTLGFSPKKEKLNYFSDSNIKRIINNNSNNNNNIDDESQLSNHNDLCKPSTFHICNNNKKRSKSDSSRSHISQSSSEVSYKINDTVENKIKNVSKKEFIFKKNTFNFEPYENSNLNKYNNKEVAHNDNNNGKHIDKNKENEKDSNIFKEYDNESSFVSSNKKIIDSNNNINDNINNSSLEESLIKSNCKNSNKINNNKELASLFNVINNNDYINTFNNLNMNFESKASPYKIIKNSKRRNSEYLSSINKSYIEAIKEVSEDVVVSKNLFKNKNFNNINKIAEENNSEHYLSNNSNKDLNSSNSINTENSIKSVYSFNEVNKDNNNRSNNSNNNIMKNHYTRNIKKSSNSNISHPDYSKVFNINSTDGISNNLHHNANFSQSSKVVLVSGLRKLNRKKILIVDDTETIRKSLKRLLLKNARIENEFEIIEAKDGIDMLNKVMLDQTEGNRIKMIITDEHMEYMSGSTAVSIIRQLEKESKVHNIYIASLTAFTDEETRNNILNKGVDKVFMKPMSALYLKDLIEESDIFSNKKNLKS